MTVEEQVKKAAAIGWFMPTIPIEEFSALLSKELELRRAAENATHAIWSEYRALYYTSIKDKQPDAVILSFFSKRRYVETYGWLKYGGVVIGKCVGEFCMDWVDSNWHRYSCPNPHIPPSPRGLCPSAIANTRYLEPMSVSDYDGKLYSSKCTSGLKDAVRIALESLHKSNALIGGAQDSFFTRDARAFDVLFSLLGKVWVDNPKDASEPAISSFKIREKQIKEEERREQWRKDYEERERITKEREDAARETLKAYLAQAKLSRIRSKKNLNINPLQVIGAMSKLNETTNAIAV